LASPAFPHVKTQEQYGSVDPNGYTFMPITVGAPGIRSLTIQDAAALRCFLPAYEDPSALCGASPRDDCASEVPPAPTPPLPTPCPYSVPDNMRVCSSACTGIAVSPTGQTHIGQGGGALTGQTITAKLNVLNDPSLGDFIVPACLCTAKCPHLPGGGACRRINNTNQQNQGGGGGLEDGNTTVNDLIAFADQALSADCGRGGSCTQTCSTAFAPPDPVRIGEITWALQAINECFAGGAALDTDPGDAADCAPFGSQPPPTGCCGGTDQALCCPVNSGTYSSCLQSTSPLCSGIVTSMTCGVCGVVCPAGMTCQANGMCM